MKTITLITVLAVIASAGYAQVDRRTVVTPGNMTILNPYQFPNYYQNNASYINNAMQYNRPPEQNQGAYTGNADYTDPSRNAVGGAYIYGASTIISNNPTNEASGPGRPNATHELNNPAAAGNKR